jgi:hypothetical protein
MIPLPVSNPIHKKKEGEGGGTNWCGLAKEEKDAKGEDGNGAEGRKGPTLLAQTEDLDVFVGY